MIILYRGNYNRDIMSDLLNLIQDIKPHWTFSFNEDDSEADVKVSKYEEVGLKRTVEDLADSTKELVIAVYEGVCISECPKDFNGGIVDVRDHIRVYTQGKQ